MPDAAILEKPLVFLPVGNDYRTTQSGSLIDMAQAKAIFRRMVELGAENTYGQNVVGGRSATAEEQEAYKEGRLRGYFKDAPSDRHDRVIHVSTPGILSQVFVEFGFPAEVLDEDKRKVAVFFDEMNDAKAQIARAERRAKFEGEVESFLAENPQNPAVERYIRKTCVFGRRGAHVPSSHPADWKDRLSRVTNPYGGKTTGDAPYQPEPSGYRLLTAKRVSLTHTQEQYADYSTSIIPVEKVDPTDTAAANRNLAQIAKKLQTHNGFAGSGSTHSFSLHDEEDGCYVLMTSRHSISD